MKPYSNIADLIKNLESDIEVINDKITTLKKKPKSFNEEVIFKYIDTRSTGKTKDFVRAQGVKSERGSLFSSSDVTRLIKDGADDISPDLLAIARSLAGVAGTKKKKGK